jgi:membrane-associated phospholipid phosphatase
MKHRGLRALALVLSLNLCPATASAQDLQPPLAAPPAAVGGQPAAGLDAEARVPLPVPGLGELFRASARDFQSLPTRSNLLMVGAGLASSGLFLRSDTAVSSGLSSARWADDLFGASSLTGQFPLHLAAGFAAYGVGRANASPRVALLGADLVRAQLLAQGTTQAIKFAVGRTRPDGSSHSFPSGHTSTMFATATVLQRHFGWSVGAPAYAAAAYVAAGRIQSKRHYLSDVAFGAALGVVAGRTVTVGRGKAKFSVAPMAAPGGAGIGFTLVN